MNIAKIAQLAGVSPATVSRYLNNGYVSDEKKEIIRKVIEETGYIPSQSAQTMRTNRHNLIGVVVPRLSSESVSRMVDGISAALKGTKYNILLATTYNSTEKELDFLNIFKSNNVDGVILIGTVLTTNHHRILKSYPKPLVLLSQYDRRYSCVYYDDYGAAYTLTKHMIENGGEKFGCIHCFFKDKAAGKARFEGFSDALKDSGLTIEKSAVCESDFDSNGGYEAMKKIYAADSGINAVFCATDRIALGAMNYLSERKITIGTDVMIAGVGDSQMSRYLNPPITSIRLHYKTGGSEACRLLLDMMQNGTNADSKIKLGYDLVERESTLSGSAKK